ncbi:hypothetical protein F511_02764 [Dorcoceras hygrometricum]|uniref:Uncharacterized protein n=1 Tax=Dorcoceras hygrometricum TaxID=472368 RepID=A0A2Z7DJG6_9LAMI|nr:hypothetical protein F511_02764 [Dorcoceras hygrometricum]
MAKSIYTNCFLFLFTLALLTGNIEKCESSRILLQLINIPPILLPTPILPSIPIGLPELPPVPSIGSIPSLFAPPPSD